MTELMKQLINEIDGYLKDRTIMDPLDRELIIRLKDHLIGQDRVLEGLIQDRRNLILDRP